MFVCARSGPAWGFGERLASWAPPSLAGLVQWIVRTRTLQQFWKLWFVDYPLLRRRLETKLYGNDLKQLEAGLAHLRNSPAYASYGRAPAEPHCTPE